MTDLSEKFHVIEGKANKLYDIELSCSRCNARVFKKAISFDTNLGILRIAINPCEDCNETTELRDLKKKLDELRDKGIVVDG